MCLYDQGVMHYFPDEVLEHVFDFLTSYKDRNAVSMVCGSWYRVEKFSREKVFVGNCYAISPERMISRFPRLRSLTLKGKPHFANFNLLPPQWGGYAYPWIEALSNASVNLEELRLKRMVVSDQGLDLISRSFPNFKSLVLVSCDGFTTDGLAAIASNCRHLRELDLQEIEVEDRRGQWLSCFPDSCTSIVSLNFACLKGKVNLPALEGLVARCKNLTSLRLNRLVPLSSLHRILKHCPQLTDLGTGSFVSEPNSNACLKLKKTLKRSSVRSLSGFFQVSPCCLPSVYPMCANLTSLNLSCSPGINCAELIKLLEHCRKLERLWVLDTIGDKGLFVVASNCTNLKELRVFPSYVIDLGYNTVTEEGLVAVSAGCPKLTSLLYFCRQMTNAALVAVAKNCPNFTRFRLCTLNRTVPDAVTKKPLDEGFGEIAKSCKGLKRLSVSGHLTDQVFLYIGMYAGELEMLSIAFAGDSDKGMLYVLNGCKKLKKLEIRDCPFGDDALLADMGKYETMRSLWMSSCEVTMGACKVLAKKMPRLNVEIIKEAEEEEEVGERDDDDDGQRVEKMYLYRTLDGRRKDAPGFVWTL